MDFIYGILEAVTHALMNPVFLSTLVFIIGILILFKKTMVQSRWHHTFDDIQISAQDLFKAIEESLQQKGIKGVELMRTTHRQVYLIGSHREYLSVKKGVYVFDICTAHVGTGCYVSWWFFDKETYLRRLVLKVPIIRYLASVKTLHQIDEEDAFQDMVHSSVLASVDAMTGATGSTLSEAERSIISIRNLTRPT